MVTYVETQPTLGNAVEAELLEVSDVQAVLVERALHGEREHGLHDFQGCLHYLVVLPRGYHGRHLGDECLVSFFRLKYIVLKGREGEWQIIGIRDREC
jgi:hypothetical protein